MAVIKVQKVPRPKVSAENTLAKFCYYFPQYTYAQARQVPYKRVMQMLKAATIEQAKFFHELAQIAAAPHSHKGKSVNKLLKKYEKIITS